LEERRRLAKARRDARMRSRAERGLQWLSGIWWREPLTCTLTDRAITDSEAQVGVADAIEDFTMADETGIPAKNRWGGTTPLLARRVLMRALHRMGDRAYVNGLNDLYREALEFIEQFIDQGGGPWLAEQETDFRVTRKRRALDSTKFIESVLKTMECFATLMVAVVIDGAMAPFLTDPGPMGPYDFGTNRVRSGAWQDGAFRGDSDSDEDPGPGPQQQESPRCSESEPRRGGEPEEDVEMDEQLSEEVWRRDWRARSRWMEEGLEEGLEGRRLPGFRRGCGVKLSGEGIGGRICTPTRS